MNVLRMQGVFICRVIKSKAFWVAVCMIFTFRLLGLLPMLLEWGQQPDGSFSLSGNTQHWYTLVGASFFYLMIMVVPVLPYSNSFCNDYTSNVLICIIMNIGRSMYSKLTVTTCAISSFLCVFFGDLVLAIGLSCFIPIYDVDKHTFWQGVSLLLLKMCLLALQGAFFGIVALILSTFTLNKFIIYTSPLILYFFFMFLGENVLHIPMKANPSFIYNGYVFGTGNEWQSVLYAFIYLLFVMYFASKILDGKIERCY